MRKKEIGKLFVAVTGAVLFLSACKSRGVELGAEPLSLDQVLGQQEQGTFEDMAGEEQTIWVHICGAVQFPGVYELERDSRVYDGLMAAGGFTEAADTGALNLARHLEDGMQIQVPELVKEIDLIGQNPAREQSGMAADGRININTASEKMLQELPGIGQSRARDIVAYREKHGEFQNTEQIMKVSGIKEAVYEKIADQITVGN